MVVPKTTTAHQLCSGGLHPPDLTAPYKGAYERIFPAGRQLHTLVPQEFQGVPGAGDFEVEVGTGRIAGAPDQADQLAGLHQRSPLLAMTLMMALFGLAGIPPTNGFVSKLLLFNSGVEAGRTAGFGSRPPPWGRRLSQ